MVQENRVGAKITTLRESLGLSRGGARREVRCDPSTITQLEAGEVAPSLAPLIKITRALGVRLGTLLDDDSHIGPVVTRQGRGERHRARHATSRPVRAPARSTSSRWPPARRRGTWSRSSSRCTPASEHELSAHEGEEFIHVLEGTIEVEYGKDLHTLDAGRQHLLRLDRPAPGARAGCRRRPASWPSSTRRSRGSETHPRHRAAHRADHRPVLRQGRRGTARQRVRRLPRPRSALDLRASSTSASTALAKGLLAIGMEKGDHLGIWARNVPDWLTFTFATAKIGVVLVTVNPVYKSHELAYVIKQSDMKALVHHRRVPRRRLRRDRARAGARGGHPGARASRLARVPAAQEPHLHGPGEAPRLLHHARAAPARRALPDERRCEAATHGQLTPTTSSTCSTRRGPPASPRASCSRAATSSTTASTSASARSSPPRTASACRCRCSTASASCSACLAALTHGATLVMVESFDPVIVLAAIQKERATALYGVPTMFIAELGAPDVRHVRPHVACAPASWPARRARSRRCGRSSTRCTRPR